MIDIYSFISYSQFIIIITKYFIHEYIFPTSCRHSFVPFISLHDTFPHLQITLEITILWNYQDTADWYGMEWNGIINHLVLYCIVLYCIVL